jgi:hypothetical protein
VSHVKYELGFYIPEDGILHSHRRENLKSYMLNLISPTLNVSMLYRPLHLQPWIPMSYLHECENMLSWVCRELYSLNSYRGDDV